MREQRLQYGPRTSRLVAVPATHSRWRTHEVPYRRSAPIHHDQKTRGPSRPRGPPSRDVRRGGRGTSSFCVCVARGVAVRWMRGCLGRGRGARVRLAASGGLQPLASSALRRSLADGFAVCKAMQNSNQARWKCHSCPAVQSLAPTPCFLVCYWTLVGKHGAAASLGPPSRPNRWCTRS